jgi:hypothetical protein
MTKFGMYTKGANESTQHINVVEVPDQRQAEAYFAGRKGLTLEQFRIMKLNELDILEGDFDLFVALDDTEKIEFLFDATEMGVEQAVVKQVEKLTRSIPPIKMVSTEDYQVGDYRLAVTLLPDELQLNSNSLKAINKFVAKVVNDGLLISRLDKKKSEWDLYRYFRAYKIIGKVGPFSNN